MKINRVYRKGLQYVFGKKGISTLEYIRENDTFLISFPKSGNTWVRHMLAVIKSGRQNVTLSEMEKHLEIARDIGCHPEIWKLSLSMNKHYEWRLPSFEWVMSFLRCQYTLVMRFTKLVSEESR